MPLRAAVGPGEPVPVIHPASWVGVRFVELAKPIEQSAIVGGSASGVLNVPPGDWYAWIEGSMGPGVAVWVRPVGGLIQSEIGIVRNDMGMTRLWHPIGAVKIGGPSLVHVTWVPRPWWKASSRHPNVVGPIVFTRVGAQPRIETIPLKRVASLCGRRVDWLELPPA